MIQYFAFQCEIDLFYFQGVFHCPEGTVKHKLKYGQLGPYTYTDWCTGGTGSWDNHNQQAMLGKWIHIVCINHTAFLSGILFKSAWHETYV